MKEITLQVNGREMTFSEQELTAIVEKHFSNKTTKKATTSKVPSAERWFEVKPMEINKELFEKKREDREQETIRQLILEAFAEMEKNPFKYSKNFKTKILPKSIVNTLDPTDPIGLVFKYGYNYADWVEQALEWAQRIANGQSWKSLCNDPDTSDWYRGVRWKDGLVVLVGGSIHDGKDLPATYIGYSYRININNPYDFAVPLVCEDL